MKKIRFVQLEPDAFLTDMDFLMMTAEQRGVYCTIILFLYCNNGKCEFDADVLSQLCNCEDFERVWKKIRSKFQIKQKIVRHRRVTRELTKARRFLQHQRKAGLASAKARNSKLNGGSAAAGPSKVNETRSNVTEKESKETSYSNPAGQSFCASSSVRVRSLGFNEALSRIIIPRSQSDRTSFRNISNWLVAGCVKGRFTDEIFERVLEYAAEAAKGKSRNPAAVFTSLLKKELGYRSLEKTM